jgi:hypothetical protein
MSGEQLLAAYLGLNGLFLLVAGWSSRRGAGAGLALPQLLRTVRSSGLALASGPCGARSACWQRKPQVGRASTLWAGVLLVWVAGLALVATAIAQLRQG